MAEGAGVGVGDEPVLMIRLLGGFVVTVDGEAVPDGAWSLQKARALIKLLALAPRQRLAREQVLDLLWPDLDPEAGVKNLYSTLSIARRVLAPAARLSLRGGMVALETDTPIQIDAIEFEAGVAAARRDTDPARYEAALARYSGELLPEDRYEDWAAPRREVLRGLFREALQELAALHEARGERAAAIAALRRLVGDDPLDERAVTGLMRLLALDGRGALALRQFAALREALAREIDAEPGPEARRLNADIATGRFPSPSAGSAAPAVAPSTPPPAPTQNPVAPLLPIPLTSLIGRERDVEALRATLAEDGARLVTLIGSGGSGKTRLALATAHAALADFPHGVCFVELATLADPALVPRSVAAQFGISEQVGADPASMLVASLRDHAVLLVIDNCEHLIDAVADLVATLLAGCPQLRIVATSREALRLPGEIARPVPPLDVPSADLPRPHALGMLGEIAAVALFVDRARRRLPTFALTAENAPAIVAICRRLEGHPLALELAAARVGVLSVAQIAARLDDALGTLTARERGVPARQQTLRATLDWSHALLRADEQALLRHLAPFAGGFDLSAAVAVAGDGASDVLAGLEGLVDKSLLVVEPYGDDVRYRLLEPVRQYAAERLDAVGERDEYRRRHCDHFLALAEELDPLLWRARQAEALARLEVEHDNLRAALRWALDAGEPERALRLVGVVWRFWMVRGHMSEGRRWLADVLAAGRTAPPSLRTKPLNGAGVLALTTGDVPEAIARFEERLALLRGMDDPLQLAGCLANLGWALVMGMGDFARAATVLVEGLAVTRASGDDWQAALCLKALGQLALLRGEPEEGVRLLAESAATFRAQGSGWGLAIALIDLGEALIAVGDAATARERQLEGLDLALADGDRVNIAYGLEGLGRAAAALGAPARAATLWGATAALRATTGGAMMPVERARHERGVAAARERLGATAFADAWAEGQSLALADAVALARQSLADAPPADETGE
jgi:predicted ATPase/DNA-binding SARP family transcriptional activator